jgi:hypothetical protein
MIIVTVRNFYSPPGCGGGNRQVQRDCDITLLFDEPHQNRLWISRIVSSLVLKWIVSVFRTKTEVKGCPNKTVEILCPHPTQSVRRVFILKVTGPRPLWDSTGVRQKGGLPSPPNCSPRSRIPECPGGLHRGCSFNSLFLGHRVYLAVRILLDGISVKFRIG